MQNHIFFAEEDNLRNFYFYSSFKRLYILLPEYERWLSNFVKYIDIHSHILPGIDDGAKNMETSLRMLRIAADEGIKEVILTPHYKPGHHNASPETVRKLTVKLQGWVLESGLEMTLLTGNEILYHRNMTGLLSAGEVCTLANTHCVLVEFFPAEEYVEIRSGVYQIRAEGYRPVLAHVERYQNVCRDTKYAEELIQMGAYIQINAGSIMGNYGFSTKQFCKRLLKKELVHFVATDSHDTGRRAPHLRDCGKYLISKFGEAYADSILYGNARRILSGDYL